MVFVTIRFSPLAVQTTAQTNTRFHRQEHNETNTSDIRLILKYLFNLNGLHSTPKATSPQKSQSHHLHPSTPTTPSPPLPPLAPSPPNTPPPIPSEPSSPQANPQPHTNLPSKLHTLSPSHLSPDSLYQSRFAGDRYLHILHTRLGI